MEIPNYDILIKFISKEFVNNFKNGELYFPLLKEFWAIEDTEKDSVRGDNREGFWMSPVPEGTKLSIKPYDDPTSPWMELKYKTAIRHSIDSRFANLPIACFTHIKLNELLISEDNYFKINPDLISKLEFLRQGRETVMIGNPTEYLERLKVNSNSKGYKLIYGPVNYLNYRKEQNITSEEFEKGSLKPVFTKDEKYDYQREFRILLDNKGHEEAKFLNAGNINDISFQCHGDLTSMKFIIKEVFDKEQS